MNHIRSASTVLFIHGVIETFSSLMSFAPSDKIKNHIFALPFLKENLITVGAVGAIFGILRIIAAIGLRRERLWSWYLAVVMCVITLALMIFMVPSGIGDGILTGLAIVWLLIGRYGREGL